MPSPFLSQSMSFFWKNPGGMRLMRTTQRTTMTTFMRAAFAGFALLVTPVAAEAAKVSPMIAELQPVGRNSVLRVTLTNDGETDVPYEILMLRGEISPDGELQTTPADDLFLVFPTQTIVEARSQQVFRVQYIGDPELETSEVFYMGIRQVPIATEGTIAQVQLVVNYNVLINVVPRGAVAQPAIDDIRAATREDVVGIEFVAGNEGNRFYNAGLSEWSISGVTVDGEDYERNYDRGQLSRAVGVGVVAPGRTRNFFVPTEAPLQPDTIRIEIRP